MGDVHDPDRLGMLHFAYSHHAVQHRKPARNALSLGADFGRPISLPTIELAKKHLERAEESCGNDVHWSALAIVLREQAGLSLFDLGTSHRRRRDLTL